MKTIRKQLATNLLLAIAALLIISGLSIFLLTESSLENQFNSALLARAEAIMSLTEARGTRIEMEFSDEIMMNYNKNGTDFFELYRADGKSVERSPSLGELHLPLLEPEITKPVYRNMKLPDGRLIKTVTVKFSPQTSSNNRKNAKVIEAILIVGSDRSDLDNTISSIQLVLFGCGIVLLVLSAIVVNYIIKRELTPLQKLADEAEKIDADSLSARFSTDNLPLELLPIATRLNESLARLEQSFDRERRFTSYIAHELRTPVSELRAIAELISTYPDARTPETDKDILAIALQLESLIQRLLMLSRAERSDLQIQRQEIRCLDFITAICDLFKPIVQKRNLSLNIQIPPSLTIFSDRILIKTILSNLIENAVEYTPAGGSIKIESVETNGLVNINIANTVNDLTDDDVKHFFERFWRKDRARSPSTHIGIGLNLSSVIARALGYEIYASLNPDSQLTVTIANIKKKQN